MVCIKTRNKNKLFFHLKIPQGKKCMGVRIFFFKNIYVSTLFVFISVHSRTQRRALYFILHCYIQINIQFKKILGPKLGKSRFSTFFFKR